MPIYNVQAPNGKTYKVEGPENADPNTLFGFVQQQVEADDVQRLRKEYGPGVLGTFGRGVKRGAGELASTFTDIIPAAVGSAFGQDEYAKEQMAEAAQKRAAREAEAPAMFRSYKDVEGIGDVPRYLAETIGEQVPNIATTLIPGVGAEVMAARAGMGAAGKAAATGAGVYLGSYAQNAPEVFQNIYENTGQLAPGAAAIWGAASAALDSVLPAKLVGKLTGPAKMGIVEKILEKSGMDKGLLRSVTANAISATPMEGLTEGAQEAISIAAENFVANNPQVFGSKEWNRIMESAVKGAVAGGAFGGAAGVSEYGQAGAERRAAYADALERRGDRLQAAEVRRQSAEIESMQGQQPQMDLPGFEMGPATGLYTQPAPEPAGPKELKGKQAELFTPEGELTPGVEKAATRDEKMEANKQRQEAQRQAAELKEAQAKLKKFLSAKQATLPGFDEESVKTLQEQNAAQQQAAQEAGQGDLFNPQPTTTPAVTPEVQPAPTPTVVDDSVLKGMGIGHTSLIRKNKLLEGKDISKPEDAAEVKRILEAYVENRSQPIREKVEAFLGRPEFQGAADVARPVAQPTGASAVVPSEPGAVSTAGAVEPTEPNGVVPTGEAVGEPAVRETEQPAALEEAPADVTPEVIPEPKKLGKRAQKDLAKAEAGAVAAKEEQAQFVQQVDQNVDNILTSRLREAGREAGLTDSDLPSDTYRGSDAHNLLRLPHLFAQYRDSEALAKESAGTPQEAKNQQQMQQIEEEIAKTGPDALAMFQQLRNLPVQRQDQMLSHINRTALQEFDKVAQDTVSKVQAEIAAQKAAPAEKQELTDDELDALTNDFAAKFFEQTGRKIFLPAYEGPTFNEADTALAQKGDGNGLLRSLLDQIKDPAIKQVLRRLRSLNLNAKIVITPVEDGKAGSYDPVTNTITLDPKNGLNAHTFIHESVHAALAHVLANPNHPLTKDFTKFFAQIKDRMGAAYGAQDLQEFAAELVGNPSFQALLKTIKTPKSDSLFTAILRKIAEFFGFHKTAFDTGLDFLHKAIDLSGNVEPTATQKMFNGMGNFPAVGSIGKAMPALAGRTIESTKNFLSNLHGTGVQEAAFGLLRLDNINQMYGKELPSIQTLLDSLEKRNGTQERMIKAVNSNYHNFRKVEQKYRSQMQRMSDIAIDARLAQVDLLDPKFQPDATNQAEYNRLSQAFRALPKEVQDVYRTIRGDYDTSFTAYKKILHDAAASVSPSLAARLNEQFELQKPLVSYVPFLRSGEYWVEFTDPKTGEPAAQAFESLRERQQFIDSTLKGIPNRAYQNLEDVRFSGEGLPPTSFIMQVMNGMRNNNATQQQLDAVYQAYLTTFPAQSIMKQFMKSKNVAGMQRDIINGYGDVMVRWARKLANSEYVPQIDKALHQIRQEAGAQSDPTVYAAAQNVMDQSAFFHNPNFGTFTSTATTLSYAEYILGNISSALINVTSLPMMVYPMLTGKFGWGDATAAMTAAGKTAMGNWGNNAKYKNLYNTLMDHAQLEHTMAREVLEGRRQKTSDYLGIKARILDGLSIPFAATEKYNRGVTAIAAYDLARKSGMNEDAAVRYALNTVKDVHTSGLAATGPRWMQTPMGRMFFTFKSFVWNSAYVMARAFHQAFKGETPEVRKAAQRQLLATYGMATVFTGIKGMPFYGATSVLAQMINALFGDEDEPFDYDEFLRDIFGEFLYKGAFNYATNLEISNRAGIATDLLFRDDPRGIAEHGYVLSAMQQMFGPAGTIAVNSGNAIKMMQEGHVERAIETMAPSFMRNFMKGARYMVEGATTLKGDPVMEDISAYNSLMQVIGFSPADLSSQYERVQAAKGYEREVLARRTQLLQLYDMGHTAGDYDLMSDASEKIQAFNEHHPKDKITPDTIRRSIKARQTAEKEMIHGVRFNKKLRGEIEDKFFDEE